MKKIIFAVFATILLAYSVAMSAEIKAVATIDQISVKGKTATVVLKDTKTNKKFNVTVNDELTVDKFNDKRIVSGDEVRVKYDDSTGVTKLFKKTAGC